MDKTTGIKLFENRKVRSVWDAEGEQWYISIVDVIIVGATGFRPTTTNKN